MAIDSTHDQIQAEVARLLSEARTGRGLSMNMLAAKSGLSQSLISSFEKTPWNPTLGSLLRMAEVLEVNLGDVLKSAILNVEKNRHSDEKPVRAAKRPAGK